ncbi:MAG: undecaprenyl-phosphate glucose phosphotransferase [Alphaproteobacteria bacterium]|nr:undecaprenyl-phosphate glucose phosphotransferase [Alphaproteobacteria bacterium]
MRLTSPILTADLQTVLAGLLRIVDLLLILAIGFATYWLRNRTVDLAERDLAALAVAGLLAVIYLHVARVYEGERLGRLNVQIVNAAAAWGGVVLTLLAIGYFTKTSANFSRIWLAAWFTGALVALVLVRLCAAALFEYWRTKERLQTRAAVLGAGEAGRRLVAYLRAQGAPGLRLVGLFGDSSAGFEREVAGIPERGTVDDLLDFARREQLDEILIAVPWDASDRLRDWTDKLRTLPVTVKLYPENVDPEVPVRGVSFVGGLPMLDIYERPLSGWDVVLKFVTDWLLAALILIPALPIMGLIAVAIRLDSPGPIFFRQKRYGFNNNVFTVLKFRTMRDDPVRGDAVPQATRHDPRVTRIGRFLRQTSLDELPQLLNVLAGQMALIGPRPHAVAHNREYAEIIDGYLGRHKVRPGITGWAQINGLRGETDTPEKMRMRVQYDLYYIDHWSPVFDLKILFLTPFVGFVHRHAY